jgi:hypothetical protein
MIIMIIIIIRNNDIIIIIIIIIDTQLKFNLVKSNKTIRQRQRPF